MWRKSGYLGVTPTTARPIAYWTDSARSKKLLFCEYEALETAIYIAEVAKKYSDAWIENSLREANDLNGEVKNYISDFIVCVEDGRGPGDLLDLIVEVTGEKKKEKAARVSTPRTLWVPAINNPGAKSGRKVVTRENYLIDKPKRNLPPKSE